MIEALSFYAVVFSVALISWEAAIAIRAAKFAIQMPEELLSIPSGSSNQRLTRSAIFREELISLSLIIRAIPALLLGLTMGGGLSLFYELGPVASAGLSFSATTVLFLSSQAREYLMAFRDGMNRSNTLAYLRSDSNL